MTEKELKQIPLTATFIALGIVFPQLFHIIGSGSVFLPMFLPVYMGAMFLTWKYTLLISLLTPGISFLITGMPPVVPPILFLMMLELSLGALIISAFYVHLSKPVWFSLISGIIAGRTLYFLTLLFILPLFGYDSAVFSFLLVFKALPGIILQLLVIPFTVKILSKKYPSLLFRD